ncbi:hypothetical protein [Actinomadura sp. NTSP31]|uniref:hypothetical protein n=1 Tax=Actinomadura sp. NTSP31 TaxID=1735447 RepID=UPI0035C09710
MSVSQAAIAQVMAASSSADQVAAEAETGPPRRSLWRALASTRSTADSSSGVAAIVASSGDVHGSPLVSATGKVRIDRSERLYGWEADWQRTSEQTAGPLHATPAGMDVTTEEQGCRAVAQPDKDCP